MKRALFIVVIWVAALLPVAAQAQSRSMGFRGPAAPPRTNSGFAGRSPAVAGRPAGFAPRPSAFAPRPGPGMRFASPSSPASIRRSSPQSRVFITGRRGFIPGQRAFFPHHRRFHRFARNSFFFPHSCFNGFFDPFCENRFFFGSSVISPFDPFFTSFSYLPPQTQQPVVIEQDGNSRELAQEVQELTDEVEAMREEQQMREKRSNAESRPAPQDDGPNATLILRDGTQLSIRNYAIAGDTVWVLDDHRAQKIPISKLDVAATEQANAKNGVEMHLPK